MKNILLTVLMFNVIFVCHLWAEDSTAVYNSVKEAAATRMWNSSVFKGLCVVEVYVYLL